MKRRLPRLSLIRRDTFDQLTANLRDTHAQNTALRRELSTLRDEHHLVLTWWNPDGTPHDSAPVHIHPGDTITIINKRRSGQDVTMRCEAQPGPAVQRVPLDP